MFYEHILWILSCDDYVSVYVCQWNYWAVYIHVYIWKLIISFLFLHEIKKKLSSDNATCLVFLFFSWNRFQLEMFLVVLHSYAMEVVTHFVIFKRFLFEIETTEKQFDVIQWRKFKFSIQLMYFKSRHYHWKNAKKSIFIGLENAVFP